MEKTTSTWKETACTSLSFTFFTSKNALPKKPKTHHSLNFVKNTKFFKYLLHRNLFFNQRPYFAQNIW